MSRILLADDSPHAQRMGERILRDEGHVVVTVTDGNTAMMRLKDVDPDVVFADVSMPGVSGYELCEHVKTSGAHKDTRVLLTVGAVEPLDDAAVERVRADGVLRKPFEATALLAAVGQVGAARPRAKAAAAGPVRSVVVLDPEQVRAAVTLAVDASMASMIDQITERVLIALHGKRK